METMESYVTSMIDGDCGSGTITMSVVKIF